MLRYYAVFSRQKHDQVMTLTFFPRIVRLLSYHFLPLLKSEVLVLRNTLSRHMCIVTHGQTYTQIS